MTFDRIKPKYSDKSSPGATFFYHKSHTDCPEIKPELQQWEGGRQSPELW